MHLRNITTMMVGAVLMAASGMGSTSIQAATVKNGPTVLSTYTFPNRPDLGIAGEAFSSNGMLAVASSYQEGRLGVKSVYEVTLWNGTEWKRIWRGTPKAVNSGVSMAWTPTNRLVIDQDSSVSEWNGKSWVLLGSWGNHKSPTPTYIDNIESGSSTGTQLAINSKGQIALLGYSPSKQGGEYVVDEWSKTTGWRALGQPLLFSEASDVDSLAWSPSGELILVENSGFSNSYQVALWDGQQWRRILSNPPGGPAPNLIMANQPWNLGNHLALSNNGYLQVWNGTNWKAIPYPGEPASAYSVKHFQGNGAVIAYEWSPTNHLLVETSTGLFEQDGSHWNPVVLPNSSNVSSFDWLSANVLLVESTVSGLPTVSSWNGQSSRIIWQGRSKRANFSGLTVGAHGVFAVALNSSVSIWSLRNS